MPAARNTRLRLIPAAPLPSGAIPAVLGVDDWALRKRHAYGAVLIDLEQRRRVALLPNREEDTLAQWLSDHPGVEIIARDRAGAYAEGARRGAPQAVQVADRFHLVQSVAEVLETVFTPHAADLRMAESANQNVVPAQSLPLAPPRRTANKHANSTESRERRLATHQRVWALHDEGGSSVAIACHLGLGRSTIVRFLRHATFPERQKRHDAGRSLLDPWKPMILDRWNADCRHSRQLFRETQGRGYRGSYRTLAHYTQRLRLVQDDAVPRQSSPPRPVPPVSDPRKWSLTPRNAAWLALRRAEHRDQHAALTEAIALAEDLVAALRDRAPKRLDPWLARARGSTLPAFRNFAKKLGADDAAVRAAMALSSSTGQVEGQINRLKMIKRQMFGRVSFDLLNRRFLLAAGSPKLAKSPQSLTRSGRRERIRASTAQTTTTGPATDGEEPGWAEKATDNQVRHEWSLARMITPTMMIAVPARRRTVIGSPSRHQPTRATRAKPKPRKG
jgi:transposase